MARKARKGCKSHLKRYVELMFCHGFIVNSNHYHHLLETMDTTAPSLAPYSFGPLPLLVGIIGTGFAAQLRAEALCQDPRTHLVAVVGHSPENTEKFSQRFQVEALPTWQALIQRSDLDLVFISTINPTHGQMVQAALQADKHVVVEYPLSLEPQEADRLIILAEECQKLLHVEHIELLGGLHQTLKQNLPLIGTAFQSRYVTISPQHPAPQRWSYHQEKFGFPLMGALSRLHRLIDLWGEVAQVYCQIRYWQQEDSEYYQGVWCQSQFNFKNGMQAEIVYGKGEPFWKGENQFTVYGDQGQLVLTPNTGELIQGAITKTLSVGSRRGLFAQDTKRVIDYLLEGIPLYVTPTASAYSLKVAGAAAKSAETGVVITL